MPAARKNLVRARCGHVYHKKDTHAYCPACRSKGRFTEFCREGAPCELCKNWSQELQALIWSVRHPYKSHKKRTKKHSFSKCSDWVSQSESESDSYSGSQSFSQCLSGCSTESCSSINSSKSSTPERINKHIHRKQRRHDRSQITLTVGVTRSVNNNTGNQSSTYYHHASSDLSNQTVVNLNGSQVKDTLRPSPVSTTSVITVPLNPEFTTMKNPSSTSTHIVDGDPRRSSVSHVNLNEVGIQLIPQRNENVRVTDQNYTSLIRGEREYDLFKTLPGKLISSFNQATSSNQVPMFDTDLTTSYPSTRSQALNRPMLNKYLEERGNPLQAMHATESIISSVIPYNFEHVSRSHMRLPHSVQYSDYIDWDRSPSPVPHKRGTHSKSHKHREDHRREKSPQARSHSHRGHKSRKGSRTPSSEHIQHTDSQDSDFNEHSSPRRETSFHKTGEFCVSAFRDKSSTVQLFLEPRQELTYTKHQTSPVRMLVSDISATDNPSEIRKDYRAPKAVAEEVIRQNFEVSEKPIPPRFAYN